MKNRLVQKLRLRRGSGLGAVHRVRPPGQCLMLEAESLGVMRRTLVEAASPRAHMVVRLLIFCSLLLPLLVFPQVAFPRGASATLAADGFDRVDGGLGAGWASMADGGLSISSGVVVGSSGSLAGDIRTGETYAGDQFSQVEVTATQLSGGQWVGPAVRVQNGGQDMYLGIYFWNGGSPELRLYERSAGTWMQLGGSYGCGPLAAGTELKLVAVGSTISFWQDGVERMAVSDSSLTGGAPGIMTYGAATADNWSSGGDAPASTADPSGGAGAASTAFCYGVGTESFEWITATRFASLTTAQLGGKPDWSYGAMAFAVAGIDPSGVMGNGYRPYCGKGAPTGVVVDNQGEHVTSGYASALASYGATVKNPNGDLGVPGWYQVVTP
jgi:hypothetical protein